MAALIGRITRTGQGAAGLRILGYEEVRIRRGKEHRPCQMSHPIVNLVGDDGTDSSREFRITYTPYGEPEDACRYSSRVRVRVYDAPRSCGRARTGPARPACGSTTTSCRRLRHLTPMPPRASSARSRAAAGLPPDISSWRSRRRAPESRIKAIHACWLRPLCTTSAALSSATTAASRSGTCR